MKSNKGITLIALIITIIVLLILAGIGISLTIGENGILNHAKQAKVKTEEEAAREKLELVLLDLQAKKYTDTAYNETTYINTEITNNSMTVFEDIVFVDGWQFTIDRSVPKILDSIGKGQPNEQIRLSLTQKVSSDYVKSTVTIEIIYEGTISYIKIGQEEIAVPEKKDGKYVIQKEIRENQNISVLVKDEEEKYKLGSIQISDITEDMDIWNKSDMELFRDRVNIGRTYEERTVRIMEDIDLEGNETNQWTPISLFKGTFNGQKHSISGIYINVNSSDKGLFKTIKNAKIENLYIKNSTIKVSSHVGTLSYFMDSSTIENVHIDSDVYIVAKTGPSCWTGGIVGAAESGRNTIKKSSSKANINSAGDYTGGIAGTFYGTIDECYNKGNIIVNNSSSWNVGGIIGVNHGTGNENVFINNTYNTGTVRGGHFVGGIAGSAHTGISTQLLLTNCYNIGEINGTSNYADLIGYTGNKGKTTNCYTRSQSITATRLGNLFTNDVKNENQTWRYNKGYPILKWELDN